MNQKGRIQIGFATRHISCIDVKKHASDVSHVLEQEPIDLHEDLSYEEKSILILDQKSKALRNKEIPLVNVLWQNQMIEEASWECEDEMRSVYSKLF